MFFVAIILINAITNAKFQLHYDEAYYWAFSQHLSLSYYDHPPMIAYMIRVFSFLGHSEFAVRFVAVFTSTITTLTIYKLANRMWGSKVANIALFLALCNPLIEAVFFITTPDSPLLMFWALTLYFIYKGIFEESKSSIYLSGLFVGLGLLSKYTMILIFPSIFIFLLLSAKYRKLLVKKDLYIAFIIAIIVFSPVIIWNYQHDWISFKFQFKHGVDLEQSFNLGAFTDYLGGQVLISGIFIFLALLYFILKDLKRNFKDDKLTLLLMPCIFVLLFFGTRSLFQHMEANWPAVAYISGIIFVAYWIDRVKNVWIPRVAFGLILVVLIVFKAPMFFIPKALHNNQVVKIVNTFYGTRELLNQIKSYIKPNDTVLACDYGNASRIWFYLQVSQPYVLKDFKFAHMYQYWENGLPNPLNNAVYICDGEDSVAMGKLKSYFKNIDLLYTAIYDNNVGSREMYIYRVTN